MATFDDLLPEARIGLSEAPDFSIVAALRRSAARFCRHSHLWRDDLDPFPLVAGQDAYSLDPPSGAVVERLLTVKIDGTPLREIARLQDIKALRKQSGTPVAAALTVAGDELLLWGTPTAALAGKLVDVFAVLAPTINARTLPDFLIDEWHDAIVAGAHAEMYGNKSMPWYDEAKAQERGFRFGEEAARAKREQHSGGHARMQVRPNPWR
jgi:hypothetical protein